MTQMIARMATVRIMLRTNGKRQKSLTEVTPHKTGIHQVNQKPWTGGGKKKSMTDRVVIVMAGRVAGTRIGVYLESGKGNAGVCQWKEIETGVSQETEVGETTCIKTNIEIVEVIPEKFQGAVQDLETGEDLVEVTPEIMTEKSIDNEFIRNTRQVFILYISVSRVHVTKLFHAVRIAKYTLYPVTYCKQLLIWHNIIE